MKKHKLCLITTDRSYVYNFDKSLHKLTKCKIIKCNTKIHISGYLLKTLSYILYETDSKNDGIYAICPVYYSHKKHKLTDTQLTVTGGAGKNEYFGQALQLTQKFEYFNLSVVRELSEEIGIVCDYDKLIKCNDVKVSKKEIHNYILNDEHIRIYNPINEIHDEKIIDDKKHTVQVLILGRLNTLTNVIKNIFKRRYSRDLNNIRALRLISLGDIKQFVRQNVGNITYKKCVDNKITYITEV